MSIPSWAVKGAKVVCVYNGYLPRTPHGECGLELGAIYTVSGTDVDLNDPHPVGIILAERPDMPYGFVPSRFQPVVEQKSDNEIESSIYRKKGRHHLAPERVN